MGCGGHYPICLFTGFEKPPKSNIMIALFFDVSAIGSRRIYDNAGLTNVVDFAAGILSKGALIAIGSMP
jgi:hypothetical protein